MKEINLIEYGYLRAAAVSPECKVADISFNTKKIIEMLQLAAEKSCHVAVFPELCLSSYTAADLFFQHQMMDAVIKAVSEIAAVTGELKITAIVGGEFPLNGRLYNAAFVLSCGKCCGIVPKSYIPNYGEFYESRWFSSGIDISTDVEFDGEKIPFGTDLIFKINNEIKFGVEICEDLWAVVPPSSLMAEAGANIIFNLSASNEYLGKCRYRRELVSAQSGKILSAYVYSSAGCGESTTDTVYSGHCIIAENGVLLAENDRFNFESDIIMQDIDFEKINSERLKNKTFGFGKPDKSYREVNLQINETRTSASLFRKLQKTPFIPLKIEHREETCREIFDIQSAALAKRLKSIGCESLVIGISGGLDSTLALLVAVNAFKITDINLKNIIAVNMPGFGTTHRTKNNAEQLAELLGVTLQTIPITPAVILHFSDIGHNINDHSVTYENAQARERTQILMDIANKRGGIVLGTGDLSEIALGWSTYNADHMSMYNVNCGVPKTLVKYIIEWCAAEEYDAEIRMILKDICNTPISPELLPPDENGEIVQQTEKNVGPYLLNDFFLYHFFRFNYRPKKLFLLAVKAFGSELSEEEIRHWLSRFYSRFFRSQFKRSCIPDGPKVGTVALSPRADWRMSTDSEVNLWIDNME